MPARNRQLGRRLLRQIDKHGFEEGNIPPAAEFEAKSGPASATSKVVEPAVTLTKEAAVDAGTYSTGPITVTDGDTVHYRLKLSNTGGVAAYGVEAKDVIPAQLTEVKATTNAPTSRRPGAKANRKFAGSSKDRSRRTAAKPSNSATKPSSSP